VRPNSPRVATVVLATTALLLPFSAPVASADKDHGKYAATGDFARGPLPPPAPVKDYTKNAATGDFSGWRGVNERGEPASASLVQLVPATKPGDSFDWGDAAMGVSLGFVLALVTGGATLALVRRRIASPALSDLSKAGIEERRLP
jgi:hypothetical protein